MATPIVYVFCALVWGTTWFAIRRSIAPGGYPTVAAAAIRFTLASLVLALVWALGGARPGPKTAAQWKALLVSGALGSLSFGLLYSAEQHISGALAAVLFGTFPLCTAVLATLGGVERVSRGSILGSAIAIVGVALVFADRLDVSQAQGMGILLTLGAVLTSSLYSIVLKRVGDEINPLATTGAFLAVTAVILGTSALVWERKPIPWPPPPGATLALLYLATIGSVLTFAGYFYLMKRVKLMTLSLLVLIEPVVALAVDAVWEKDVVLVFRSYVGMAVTFAGIAVSLVFQRKRAGV